MYIEFFYAYGKRIMAKKESPKEQKDPKAAQPEKAKKEKKEKKDKKGAPLKPGDPGYSAAGKKDGKGVADAAIDRSQLTADQLTQAQIEEAIKESQDPSARLKKVHSPFNVRSCLLNILILVVLTIGIVLLCCYFMLDKETFNLLVVIRDIFNKFGITKFFRSIGNWFKKIFK